MNGQPHHTIHYTDLPPGDPDSPLTAELEVYRREVGRLIAEGHEGKHLLIKGEEILGIFGSHNDALDEGYKRFPGQDIFVHEIQTWERVYRFTPLYWTSCRT